MGVSVERTSARVAVIGNYQPRRCGIATFTTDLVGALAAASPGRDWPVIAMNDRPGGYDYPSPVWRTIAQGDPAAYRRAAWDLDSTTDLLLVQHEYGIFGGLAGNYLLDLLRSTHLPVVTTLHTILREPDAAQRGVLEELAGRSARLVVMSHLGTERLHTIYGVPERKIAYIPHGIPAVPTGEQAAYKRRFGLGDRPTMLTFGLLSPGKGIETAIRALPAIVARYPDFAYLVVGATHPNVRAHEGERYRESLLRLADELGVARNLVFHDRFVGLDELIAYIAATDLYITPYLGREQIVSGTLAYTVGAGKAVISTPYPYAEELLADGRGLLVPYGDSDAIAERTLRLLDDPTARAAIERHARLYGRQMRWPNVAARYLDLFGRVLAERSPSRPPLLAAPLTAAGDHAAAS